MLACHFYNPFQIQDSYVWPRPVLSLLITRYMHFCASVYKVTTYGLMFAVDSLYHSGRDFKIAIGLMQQLITRYIYAYCTSESGTRCG